MRRDTRETAQPMAAKTRPKEERPVTASVTQVRSASTKLTSAAIADGT
jgi:hypothetical protein